MKKKLIFRADGNSETGLGHLYRLFAFVEMIKEDYDFTFVSCSSSMLSVVPKGYAVAIIPKWVSLEEEPKWLASRFDSNNNIVIADGYQFVSSYQKKIKREGFDLIYIDDLNKEYMYADIVINHSPTTDVAIYKSEKFTRFALGTKYALLRPSFLEEAKKNIKNRNINTAFVCFGGSDKYNLSFIAIKALLEFDAFIRIYLVLGAANSHKEIFDLIKKNERVIIIQNATENKMLEIMKQSNFAIAPASTILYELCCVKIPILSGYYVENQRNIYEQLSKDNVIYKGGDFSCYSKEDFIYQINRIINDTSKLEKLKKQKTLFDGQNKNRILGLVNSLTISFIKASKKHEKLVFNWSNEKLVRHNSYNSNIIEYDEHIKWFDNRINNNKNLFLIILINDKPSGLVRFEMNNKKTTIGILISKTYRGMRLATEILKKSANEYFINNDYPIFAYIKKTNIASIKSFERAGYSYCNEVIVNNIDSNLYKLEKKDV